MKFKSKILFQLKRSLFPSETIPYKTLRSTSPQPQAPLLVEMAPIEPPPMTPPTSDNDDDDDSDEFYRKLYEDYYAFVIDHP